MGVSAGGAETTAPTPSVYQDEKVNYPSSGSRSPSKPAAGRGAPSTRWRHELPADFLALPTAVSSEDGRTYRTEEEYNDALVSQMLQDELFLEELRSHPEFNDYLEQERRIMAHYQAGGEDSGLGRLPSTSYAARARRYDDASNIGLEEEGPSFADRLSALGSAASSKLRSLVASWQGTGGKGGRETGRNVTYQNLPTDDADREDTSLIRRNRPAAVEMGEFNGARKRTGSGTRGDDEMEFWGASHAKDD
jgi:hypothetical protein